MTQAHHSPRRGGARDLFGRLLGRIETGRQRRQLHALNDHQLRDIGLARDGIEAAFRGAAGAQA